MGSSLVAVTYNSDFVPASSKEFLNMQVTIECGFTLKCICDMMRTYSQYFLPFHPTNKLKNKKKKKKEKTPGDIIILHVCTKNYDQMMPGS